MKKLLAASLCMIIFLSTPINSYASEVRVTANPRFTYIAQYAMSLKAENGTANISASLISKDSSQNCYIKCNLEKLMGTYWMQMKSFESSRVSLATLSASHPIDRGTYRVMGTFRINNEIQTAYTGNQTY